MTKDACDHSGKDDLVLQRRSFLKCSAWAGAGVVWTVIGGVPVTAQLLGIEPAEARESGLTFVQISDTHIGFDKAANPDVIGTARQALIKVKALPKQPAFLLHTGDLTHLAKPDQFDTAEHIIAETGLDAHFVPGEHDILDSDTARAWIDRFGQRSNSRGWGWYSFDQDGVHFIGLVNVVERKTRGAGSLGADQMAWLASDLAQQSSSTPIVVFAHIPLMPVYVEWGWATEDADQAFALLKRFGSVTVLNGHIHQIMQKVEGNVTFHTGRSTAYPQPAPGQAPTAGPLTLPAEQLASALGISSVVYRLGTTSLAVTDATLADA